MFSIYGHDKPDMDSKVTLTCRRLVSFASNYYFNEHEYIFYSFCRMKIITFIFFFFVLLGNLDILKSFFLRLSDLL